MADDPSNTMEVKQEGGGKKRNRKRKAKTDAEVNTENAERVQEDTTKVDGEKKTGMEKGQKSNEIANLTKTEAEVTAKDSSNIWDCLEDEEVADEKENAVDSDAQSTKKKKKKKKKKNKPLDSILTEFKYTPKVKMFRDMGAIGEGMAEEKTMTDVFKAIELFFRNKFEEAQNLFEDRGDTEPYPALALGMIWGIKGMMTFEHEDIATALKKLNHAVALCKKHRKGMGWVESWTNAAGALANMNHHELHAEMVAAEAVLFKAILTFLEGESFGNFIRGGLDIKSSNGAYKTMWTMLEKYGVDSEDGFDVHWITGAQLGYGVFNLMVSLLPPRIMRLAQFVGFGGDRVLGLGLLEEAASLNGLRSAMSSLMLLLYHAYVGPMFEFRDYDVLKAEKICLSYLKKYEESIIFNFYRGRILYVKTEIPAAIEVFEKTLEIPHDAMWDKLLHICWWELNWCYSGVFNFKGCIKYSKLLKENNTWSPVMFSYLHAAYMYVEDGHTAEVDEIMTSLPSKKQTFAGKSIPLEKFLIRKSRKYKMQGNYLFLPQYELAYVWQGLKFLSDFDKLYTIVVEATDQVKKDQEAAGGEGSSGGKKGKKDGKITRYYVDDLCMGYLFQGVALMHMGKFEESLNAFESLFKLEKGIELDHYIAPFAHYECGKLHLKAGEKSKARQEFKTAINSYKHYSNESRLHFLLQSQLAHMDEKMDDGGGDVSGASGGGEDKSNGESSKGKEGGGNGGEGKRKGGKKGKKK